MDDQPAELPEHQKQQRLGFLRGALKVPADFDRMGEEDVNALFEGETPQPPAPPQEKE